MNKIVKINDLLKKYKTGNKTQIYKKLNKILNHNKEDLLLRYNIAVIEQELNLNSQARINYNYIIKRQNNVKAMSNLYNLDLKEENYSQALEVINQILNITKDLDYVIKDKAFVKYKLNQFSESREICRFYLSKNSKDTVCLNILGLSYLAENKFSNAENIFNDILEYDKNNISALNSLGRLYHEQRNSKEAEKYFLKALKLNNKSYQILNNIAGFYREESNYKKSIEFYLRALDLNPNNSYILNNLAKCYFDLDDFISAKNYSLKAIQLNNYDGNIQKILAFIYLKEQKYKEGWSYFDGRLKLSDFIEKNESIKKLEKKLYKNKNLDKKYSYLILREQGVGDEILYGTMYKDLLNTIPNVYIECDKRLLNLFKSSLREHEDKFIELGKISNNDFKLEKLDYVLYAGSLGKYFRNEIENFPNENSYLKPEDFLVKKINNQLKKFKKDKNIGISWKSFKNRYSQEKSLSLHDFKNIFKFKNFNFINLQYGDINSEILNFKKNTFTDIITLNNIDLFNDFDSLAALLKNLDLFITVSNSTAHLAGSLGIKTLLIKPNNHAIFHYWNQPSIKTPWYKSVTMIKKNDLIKDNNILEKYL
ncbi:tetratricopeptide repeat protein [Pelagibacteraceae bacterium]|nr:tetratricopeptide repeat protein [Pelagibacteraceae bacterium]